MHEDFEDEITADYSIPDLTNDAHEEVSGWALWGLIAVAAVGLAAALGLL